ncbi:ABC transporter permease [Bacillus sp. JJ1503]|uniref:ABC transporter permease n=1 Tax=Bacillus sp. JJ1503 TaxID=3122956 RepID=UPI002FFF38E3
MENKLDSVQKDIIKTVNEPTYPKWYQIPMMEWLLLILPLVYIFIFLGISLAGLLRLSVYDETGFTLEYITRFFTEEVYRKVLLNTFKISLYVTIICLLLGYPVAYFLVKTQSKKVKDIVIGIVFISFWISLLVRTFSWMIILRSNGVINQILIGIGIIDEPIKILYNTTGVVIGMTHILLPYMILVAYSSMIKIDLRLIQAAQGLGAKSWKAFMNIFLPLSLPGVFSGSLIVFVMSIGYYVTPSILGGSNNTMVGELISDQVSVVLNWNFAATLSIILLIATFILLGVSAIFANTSFSKGRN